MGIDKPAMASNDAIRAAFVQAFAEMPGPFKLSGRGSEGRVTLSRSLAAVLRTVDLPRVYIAGYGANYHYPRRLVERALQIVEQKKNGGAG